MKNKNTGKIIFAVIGILAGIATIIFSISVLSGYNSWGYLSDTSFGGDFYTYSYRATRAAAENVERLGRMLKDAVGYILMAIGLADIAFFGVKLCEKPVVVTQSAPSQPIKKEVDEVPEI